MFFYVSSTFLPKDLLHFANSRQFRKSRAFWCVCDDFVKIGKIKENKTLSLYASLIIITAKLLL